jgi:peptide-methionine (S)-S-oxide reductase
MNTLRRSSLVMIVIAGAVLPAAEETAPGEETQMSDTSSSGRELATFGGGCFWCIEAVYERLEGIHSVVSGYAGGTVPDPGYREVSRGRTGHAEVVQVEYDPAVISYEEILRLFFKAHDPTTLNRQGADVGTQYRSIILTANPEQQRTAERIKSELANDYDGEIVTEIKPLEHFYAAEDYHQDYYEKNPYAGYCQVVIRPKLKKLQMEDKF